MNMKRLLLLGLILATLALPLLTANSGVYAVDLLGNVCSNANHPGICSDNSAGSKTNPIFGPSGIMTEIISILSLIVGIAAVIGIIVSGLMMVVSSGDSNNAATARRSIAYCLVGLVVAAVAQLMVAFVLNKL